MFMLSCKSISIENETYENRSHFKIETKTATYFFDKAVGGISRILDSDGTDWVNDLGGPRFEAPSLNHGENIAGNWQWIYFGDKETNRIFYVAQHPKDTLNDFFSYMGNTKDRNSSPDGMIVFGFSRDKGTVALETKTGITYMIGFLERKITSAEDHEWASKQINDIINK